MPKTAPWSPTYTGLVSGGNAGHLNLIGWIADFADPDNFIGTFFQEPKDQFGMNEPAIHTLLDRAEQESDPAQRDQMYQQANRLIMQHIPGVPYVHAESALAFQSNISGFVPSPVGVGGESFATVEVGEGDGEETETGNRDNRDWVKAGVTVNADSRRTA